MSLHRTSIAWLLLLKLRFLSFCWVSFEKFFNVCCKTDSVQTVGWGWVVILGCIINMSLIDGLTHTGWKLSVNSSVGLTSCRCCEVFGSIESFVSRWYLHRNCICTSVWTRRPLNAYEKRQSAIQWQLDRTWSAEGDAWYDRKLQNTNSSTLWWDLFVHL